MQSLIVIVYFFEFFLASSVCIFVYIYFSWFSYFSPSSASSLELLPWDPKYPPYSLYPLANLFNYFPMNILLGLAVFLARLMVYSIIPLNWIIPSNSGNNICDWSAFIIWLVTIGFLISPTAIFRSRLYEHYVLNHSSKIFYLCFLFFMLFLIFLAYNTTIIIETKGFLFLCGCLEVRSRLLFWKLLLNVIGCIFWPHCEDCPRKSFQLLPFDGLILISTFFIIN